jgi:hypothetical protein
LILLAEAKFINVYVLPLSTRAMPLFPPIDTMIEKVAAKEVPVATCEEIINSWGCYCYAVSVSSAMEVPIVYLQ